MREAKGPRAEVDSVCHLDHTLITRYTGANVKRKEGRGRGEGDKENEIAILRL